MSESANSTRSRLAISIPGFSLRGLRNLLFFLLGLILVAGLVFCAFWVYFHPPHQRQSGIQYGMRNGRALTLDMLKPTKPNGLGVAMMVSGGWKSQRAGQFPAWMVAGLLRRGFTVFAVCHVSQPDSTVMEIIQDMHRGVRFIRHHALDYGVDPKRLGVTGGSAGGHLSLMLATRGGPGDQASVDPVDRESSAVQAVAIFYPVTDLINLGKSTENTGTGGPPKSFVKAFGPQSTNLENWKIIGRDCSPIFGVHSNLPPTLIYHGDADTLTPLDQSLRYQQRARESGCLVEVVVHPGGNHGWLTMFWDIRSFADWFDRWLQASRQPRV